MPSSAEQTAKPSTKPDTADAVEMRPAAGGPAPNFGRRARDQKREDAAARLSALSPREREILRELVAGNQSKVIARSLNLSPRTVDGFRKKITDRLGVSSLTEAIVLALRVEIDG